MSLIFPKKEILYAPMLGTLGGGSARGFGRGGGGSPIGIEAATGMVTENVYNGITFYESTVLPSETAGRSITLTTIPGNQFYIGMIGAGAGGHRYSSGIGGFGATGIALVTVPAGVTTMTAYIGGRGDYKSSGGAAQGGQYFGGRGGSFGGAYPASSSGGGLTALITGSSLTTSNRNTNLICCVGSGGGGGAAARGGHGGGFNRNGLNGRVGETHNSEHGSGGTLSAGGARATYSGSHTSNNQADGSIYQGGQGSDSQYDGGGGGGAGYYGGGGGKGGGGYDGGAAGGGSGYIKTSVASSIYTADGGPNTTTTPQSGSQALFPEVRTASGASNFAISYSTYGQAGYTENDGNAGYVVMWNPA